MENQYIAIQEQLSRKVIREDALGKVCTIAGVDVAYEKDGESVIAAITVLAIDTLEILEASTHTEKVSFPYIPGLFSFRELPPVLKAYEKLSIKPDLIVCDGQGYAHPRRFGFACHLGVTLDVPTIGCAKKRLLGEYQEPAESRGSYSDLIDKGEVIGRVVRTQDGIKPVFVSIGHKVGLETACQWVLRLSPSYRLPETTRTADHAVNMAMKAITDLNSE